MTKTVIIGLGNVGYHLAKVCMDHPKIDLTGIISSKPKVFEFEAIPIEKEIHLLSEADIYIVCTPDDLISELDLQQLSGLVVHTSGTRNFLDINAKNRGVLYPLQSFTQNVDLDFSNVPLCIESEDKSKMSLLEEFAKLLSNKVYTINEVQRKKLHLAAVFINNFSNHMLALGKEICDENDIDFSIFDSIINQTFEKLKTTSPIAAQTGPAIRNDVATITQHLNQLEGFKKEIYKQITESIINTHGSKL